MCIRARIIVLEQSCMSLCISFSAPHARLCFPGPYFDGRLYSSLSSASHLCWYPPSFSTLHLACLRDLDCFAGWLAPIADRERALRLLSCTTNGLAIQVQLIDTKEQEPLESPDLELVRLLAPGPPLDRCSPSFGREVMPASESAITPCSLLSPELDKNAESVCFSVSSPQIGI